MNATTQRMTAKTRKTLNRALGSLPTYWDSARDARVAVDEAVAEFGMHATLITRRETDTPGADILAHVLATGFDVDYANTRLIVSTYQMRIGRAADSRFELHAYAS
jgi:hypothetical protein